MIELPLTREQEKFLIRLLKTEYFSKMIFPQNQDILRGFIANKSYTIEYQDWLNELGRLYTERIIKGGEK